MGREKGQKGTQQGNKQQNGEKNLLNGKKTPSWSWDVMSGAKGDRSEAQMSMH